MAIAKKGKFLFPVKAMSPVFRARYLEQLRRRCKPGQPLLNALCKKGWVVYAKRPFQHPMQVIEYLGRYTHKVAISNHRIECLDENTVSFNYKDYRHSGNQKVLKLNHEEFIRRFAMHILPRGFVRIRHFGILSSTAKIKSLPTIRAQIPLKWEPLPPEPRILEPYPIGFCPHCKTDSMITVEILPLRGPPQLKANTEHFENQSIRN